MEVASAFATVLRAPWPDELPRLKSFLRGTFSGHRSEAWLRILVAEEPERIVGAVAVSLEPAAHQAQFVMRLRQRALVAGQATKLLGAARDLARQLGATTLSSVLDTGDPLGGCLQDDGFNVIKTEEVWRLELAPLRARLQRVGARLERDGSWTVRAPVVEDLERIRKLVAPYGFRDPQAIRFSSANAGAEPGYDMNLSTVVERDGDIIAVLLGHGTRELSGHADVRAVASEWMAQSGLLNFLVLRRSVDAAISEGYQFTSLTVNTDRDHETRRLAERTNGLLTQSKQVWERTLGSALAVAGLDAS
jgi:hypothetical protein